MLHCYTNLRLRLRTEYLFVALGFVALGLIFSYPVIAHPFRIGRVWDWDQFLLFHWVPFRSVTHFHQLPLWNPYLCGGMPLFADPQVRIMTPFFLLHLAFGPTLGLHLEIPLHLTIGFIGGYLLARAQGLGFVGRVTCACVFPTSSSLFLHIAVGHAWAIPWLYLPWVALFSLLAIQTGALSWAAMGGMVTALMFGEGGVYPTTHAALLVTLLCVLYAAQRRSTWPIVVLVTIGIFGAALGAVKLLPAARLLSIYSRPTDIPFANFSVRSLHSALFSRNQLMDRSSIGGYAFYEYGAYVSPFAAALVCVGIVGSPRRLAPWIGAAMVFITLAAGEGGYPYLWQLLHRLPPFSSERATPRFIVPFVFTLGVMAAYGADFLDRQWAKGVKCWARP